MIRKKLFRFLIFSIVLSFFGLLVAFKYTTHNHIKKHEWDIINTITQTTTTTTTTSRTTTDITEYIKTHLKDPRQKIKYLKTPNQTFCDETKSCLKTKTVRWKMCIFVKTAAKYVKRREIIRNTWGSIKYVKGGLFTTIFVIGRATGLEQEMVEVESKKYNDILQVDEFDNYLNVTRKTLASMQWAAEHLNGKDFFSSADDDMSVNIGRLQQEIEKHIEKTIKNKWPEFPILCTYELWDDLIKPIRIVDDKNFISVEEYKWPVWPKFCLGGIYTMSVNVAGQMYDISRTTPILNTDDVWITGIIRNRLGMPESMLIKIKPPIAAHLGGRSKSTKINMKARLKVMQKTAFASITTKSICTC